MADTMTSHGIAFLRRGACLQCGACGCGECPHHYEAEGLHWCAIYDRRNEPCECGEDHRGCALFPDNPWVHVVRNRVCGFSFRRLDGGSMNDLPFLNGEDY